MRSLAIEIIEGQTGTRPGYGYETSRFGQGDIGRAQIVTAAVRANSRTIWPPTQLCHHGHFTIGLTRLSGIAMGPSGKQSPVAMSVM